MKSKKNLRDEFNPNYTNKLGQNILHFLAHDGDVTAIDVLIAAGADPNKADCDGMTPLHFAALNGQVDAIGILLKAGANPDAVTKAGLTIADMARHKDHGEIAILFEHIERKRKNMLPPTP